jgi:hypothetical protein
LALFRAAAAAGVLFVLAPDETRHALAAIFLGAEDVRKALPTREDVADAALRKCRANAELCAGLARGAAESAGRLKP